MWETLALWGLHMKNNKKMMFCMCCGYSQLAAATDLLCCRCSGPLVLAPQEHVKDFKDRGKHDLYM
jgi:uncharacterized paraquat-inducible protein A